MFSELDKRDKRASSYDQLWIFAHACHEMKCGSDQLSPVRLCTCMWKIQTEVLPFVTGVSAVGVDLPSLGPHEQHRLSLRCRCSKNPSRAWLGFGVQLWYWCPLSQLADAELIKPAFPPSSTSLSYALLQLVLEDSVLRQLILVSVLFTARYFQLWTMWTVCKISLSNVTPGLC